jgi:hypothetical protein
MSWTTGLAPSRNGLLAWTPPTVTTAFQVTQKHHLHVFSFAVDNVVTDYSCTTVACRIFVGGRGHRLLHLRVCR